MTNGEKQHGHCYQSDRRRGLRLVRVGAPAAAHSLEETRRGAWRALCRLGECVALGVALLIIAGTARAAPPNVSTAANVLGHSQAEIHANFPRLVWANLSEGDRLANWNAAEIALLVSTYAGANNGSPEELAGVIRIHSPGKLAAYLAAVAIFRGTPIVLPEPIPILRPRPWGGRMGPRRMFAPRPTETAPAPAPTEAGITINNTINEIFLFFRSAAGGSLSVEASLWETARFAGAELGAAAAAGQGVGWAVQKTWQAVSPDSFAKFGDQVAGIVLGDQVFLDWQSSQLLVKAGDPYSMADLGALGALPPDIIIGSPPANTDPTLGGGAQPIPEPVQPPEAALPEPAPAPAPEPAPVPDLGGDIGGGGGWDWSGGGGGGGGWFTVLPDSVRCSISRNVQQMDSNSSGCNR